jgi:hypothetical protein
LINQGLTDNFNQSLKSLLSNQPLSNDSESGTGRPRIQPSHLYHGSEGSLTFRALDNQQPGQARKQRASEAFPLSRKLISTVQRICSGKEQRSRKGDLRSLEARAGKGQENGKELCAKLGHGLAHNLKEVRDAHGYCKER